MTRRKIGRIGERNLSSLAQLDCKVYVYLENEAIGKRFLDDAEKEGFVFGDGVKPTEMHVSDIFAVRSDKKLCYVGFAGRMMYAQAKKSVVRVDYQKYVNGEAFIIER